MQKSKKDITKINQDLFHLIKNNRDQEIILSYINENEKWLDMNALDSHYNTFLILCSSRQYNQCAKKLLELGSNPSRGNIWGSTAMAWILQDGNQELFNLLIEYNVDLTTKTREGVSLNMIAIKSGKIDICKQFINHINLEQLLEFKKEMEQEKKVQNFRTTKEFYAQLDQYIEKRTMFLSLEGNLSHSQKIVKNAKI